MARPLRPLGNLLIAVSLVLGALAATTAYVPGSRPTIPSWPPATATRT